MGDSERNEDRTYFQRAPYPTMLADLVKNCKYRPGWLVKLDTINRGQGSEGLTLVITTKGYDTYHQDQGQFYRVHHYMCVPPAAYNLSAWRRWLFEQFVLVERHEAMEFFAINNRRPFAPHHGPGNDCYNVFEHGTAEDARTMFTGEVLAPKPQME